MNKVVISTQEKLEKHCLPVEQHLFLFLESIQPEKCHTTLVHRADHTSITCSYSAERGIKARTSLVASYPNRLFITPMWLGEKPTAVAVPVLVWKKLAEVNGVFVSPIILSAQAVSHGERSPQAEVCVQGTFSVQEPLELLLTEMMALAIRSYKTLVCFTPLLYESHLSIIASPLRWQFLVCFQNKQQPVWSFSLVPYTDNSKEGVVSYIHIHASHEILDLTLREVRDRLEVSPFPNLNYPREIREVFKLNITALRWLKSNCPSLKNRLLNPDQRATLCSTFRQADAG